MVGILLKGVSRTLSNIEGGAYYEIINGGKPLSIFSNCSVLDILLDSEYVFGLIVGIKRSLPKYFCIQFKILNILLGNDPNAEFFLVHIFPYSDQKKTRMDTFCTVMVLYFTYLK